MKRLNRLPAALGGLWCVFVLARIWFQHEVDSSVFGVVPKLVDSALLFFGTWLGLFLLIEVVRRRRPLLHGISLFAMIGVGTTAYATDVLQRAEWDFRFWRLKPSYAVIVKDVANERIPLRGQRRWISYRAEMDPERRVVFPWGWWFVDNWYGVVHDPTGLVMRANELLPDWSNWDAPELVPVRELFGGDLVRATHLEGPWYLCWFT